MDFFFNRWGSMLCVHSFQPSWSYRIRLDQILLLWIPFLQGSEIVDGLPEYETSIFSRSKNISSMLSHANNKKLIYLVACMEQSTVIFMRKSSIVVWSVSQDVIRTIEAFIRVKVWKNMFNQILVIPLQV